MSENMNQWAVGQIMDCLYGADAELDKVRQFILDDPTIDFRHYQEVITAHSLVVAAMSYVRGIK